MRSILAVLVIFIFSICITGCFDSDDGVIDRISSVSDDNNSISISIPNFTNNANSKFKIAGPFTLSVIFTPHGLESRTIDIPLADIWNSTIEKYVHTISNVPTGLAGVVIRIIDSNDHTLYSFTKTDFDVKAGVENLLPVNLIQSTLEQIAGYAMHRYFPLVQGYTYHYDDEGDSYFYDSNYNEIDHTPDPADTSTLYTSSFGVLNPDVYPNGGVSAVTRSSTDFEEYFKWGTDHTALYYHGEYDSFDMDKVFWTNGTGDSGFYDNVMTEHKMFFDPSVLPILNVTDIVLGNTTNTVVLNGHIINTSTDGDLITGNVNFPAIGSPPSPPTWPIQNFAIQFKQSWYFIDIVDYGTYTDCLKVLIKTEIVNMDIGKVWEEKTMELLLAPDVGIVHANVWSTHFEYDLSGNLVGINRDIEESSIYSFSTTPQ